MARKTDGFYSAAGRVGAAPSRGASSARPKQVSAWSARPAARATSNAAALGASSTTYSEYMALRRDKEGGASDEDAAAEDASAPASPAAAAAAVLEDAPVPAAAAAPAATAPDADAVAEVVEEGPEVVEVVVGGGDGEGDGEDEKEEKDEAEEAPVEVESRTVQLSKRVIMEADAADSRSRRMADLSSQLKRSFARKQEVEQVISDEIAQLSLKLQQERDIEISREAELRELLNEFSGTINEKQELIEAEKDLLAQMQALREQVDEPSIRAPIDAAMAKKADVTSIEVMLLEDLVECKEQVEIELKSTCSRADTMNGVVAALPSETDVARMRAYNWQDVEDLQEVLLSSVESMEASDAQVVALRTKLLDSVRQKREVLGEVSLTELVQDDPNERDIVAIKVSAGKAFEASKELTQEELLRVAAESSKEAAVGVAKTVAAGVTSLGSYAKSPEAQSVAASTVDLIGAVTGAVSSVGDAFQEAKKEFDTNTMSGEELTSFDKILTSLKTGVKAVQKSPTVKAKLDQAGDLVGKQLPQAGARVGKGAAGALKGAASNKEVGNPVREALDAAEKFIVTMAALGSKYFKNSKAAYFQLPGGGPSKKATADNSSTPQSPPSPSPPVETPEATGNPIPSAEVPAAKGAEGPSPAKETGDAPP